MHIFVFVDVRIDVVPDRTLIEANEELADQIQLPYEGAHGVAQFDGQLDPRRRMPKQNIKVVSFSVFKFKWNPFSMSQLPINTMRKWPIIYSCLMISGKRL